MRSTVPCRVLPWDSEFFGARIACVTQSRLTGPEMAQVLDWCSECEVTCLYFLADINDAPTTLLAESRGFNLVDVRVILETCLQGEAVIRGKGASCQAVRVASPDDINAAMYIAGHLSWQSRFHFDPRFSREAAHTIYSRWVKWNSEREGGRVFVVDSDNEVAGFLCCRTTPGATGYVELIGIAPEAQKRKLALRLVEHACKWFVECGAKRAEVVTQARNIAGQRLYQTCGFRTSEVGLWFHKWFKDPLEMSRIQNN